MVLMFSFVVVCFGVFTNGACDAHAQALPDLVVTKIACVAPEGRLQITVANKSTAAIVTFASPVADVYFGALKVGLVNLKTPTSGSILKAGGVATYLTNFYITSSVAVKVVLDPAKIVRESNESNNTATQTVAPCATQPNVTLDYNVK